MQSELTSLIFFACVAIGVSFLCSVAEAVLLSISPSYLARLKTTNPKLGAKVEKLKTEVDKPLAAILTLNTVAHTVGATGVGAQAVAIWGSGVVGIVSGVMTFLILVLSEIIPKTIGAVYWQALTPSIATLLNTLVKVFSPIIWCTEMVTRLVGKSQKEIITREHIGLIADMSVEGGHLSKSESILLKNFLEFPSVPVKEVMTPRTVIVALEGDISVDEAFNQHKKFPVSRIPIYEESLDQILGFVLRDDLLQAKADGNTDQNLKSLIRPILRIPTTSTVLRALDQLLKQQQQMAILVDEYGGTAGLITVEDIVETMLGVEIVDEADHQVDMQEYAKRRWDKRKERLAKLGVWKSER